MKKVKFKKSQLPIEWHLERVRHMLAGAFNITPVTVGDRYPEYLDRALMARFAK